MDTNQYGQLMQSLGRLEGKLESGLLAITQRQDLTNGRVIKLEDKEHELSDKLSAFETSLDHGKKKILKTEEDVEILKGDRWKFIGIISGIGLIGSPLVTILISWTINKLI